CRRLARIGIVMLSIPTALGAVGFIATTGFNLTFGRTGAFAEEPFYMYFVWGQRALSPSILMMIFAGVVFIAGRFAFRVAELASPIQRFMTRMRARGRDVASRLSLDRAAGLAQASVALALVTLMTMLWYHADLIKAWMYFISTAPIER